MSEWDFLWGLTGDELIDAMSSGGTKEDWDYVAEQERVERISELAKLWGLTTEEMEEAIETGITKKDWETLSSEERLERISELNALNYSIIDEDDEDASSSNDKEKEFINEQHRLALKDEWDHLKLLRDSNSITIEEFRRRKFALFPLRKRL